MADTGYNAEIGVSVQAERPDLMLRKSPIAISYVSYLIKPTSDRAVFYEHQSLTALEVGTSLLFPTQGEDSACTSRPRLCSGPDVVSQRV